MQTYPIKLTAHVRSYYFGERLIPEMLGKKEVPEGVVAETWEISDYREARHHEQWSLRRKDACLWCLRRLVGGSCPTLPRSAP